MSGKQVRIPILSFAERRSLRNYGKSLVLVKDRCEESWSGVA
jgi:hypothetical protein